MIYLFCHNCLITMFILFHKSIKIGNIHLIYRMILIKILIIFVSLESFSVVFFGE